MKFVRHPYMPTQEAGDPCGHCGGRGHDPAHDEPTNGRRIPQRGEWIEWGTLGGAHYSGVVKSVDSNVLYVLCDQDGVTRTVEA